MTRTENYLTNRRLVPIKRIQYRKKKLPPRENEAQTNDDDVTTRATLSDDDENTNTSARHTYITGKKEP